MSAGAKGGVESARAAGTSVSVDPGTWVSRWAWGRGRKHVVLLSAQVVAESAVVFFAIPLAFVAQQGWPASLGLIERSAMNMLPYLLATCRSVEFGLYVPLLILSPIIHLLIFQWLGLYTDTSGETRPFAATSKVLKGAISGVAVLALVAMAYGATRDTQSLAYPLLFFIYEITLTFFGVLLVHSATLITVLVLLACGIGRKRVAVIQGGESVGALAEALRAPASEYEMVGVIADSLNDARDHAAGETWLGKIDELQGIINKHDLSEVILAVDPASLSTPQRLEVAQTCWHLGAELKMVAPFQPFFRTSAQAETVGDVSLLHVRNLGLYATVPQLLKRLMDFTLASIVLICVSPLLLATAIFIKLDSRGPVLFIQERVGLNGRTFGMIKFRSMSTDADATTHKEYLKQLIKGDETSETDKAGHTVFKMAKDPRVTRVGNIIRRTSIDELPQLINVLRGKMSLVGPRPPIQYEVDEYEEWHMKRLHIRPGITGLWQVSGRSRLTFDEMVQLDISYIERWSLWFDIKILIRTIPAVLKLDDAF